MEVIFENEHIIVVSKPPRLLVHRSKECTDKDNLLKQVRNKINQYVYPIHRLDRAVSGLVIFAKAPEVVKAYQSIWHTEKIKKYYIALTKGIFKESGKFDFPLNDENKFPKESLTLYRPLILFKSSTLVEVEIKTGRRHQIRRHFARRVDHLLGDRKYGKKKYNDYYLENFELERIFLHSHKLQIKCPLTNEDLVLRAPLSPDLVNTLYLMKPEFLETISESPYSEIYDK